MDNNNKEDSGYKIVIRMNEKQKFRRRVFLLVNDRENTIPIRTSRTGDKGKQG